MQRIWMLAHPLMPSTGSELTFDIFQYLIFPWFILTLSIIVNECMDQWGDSSKLEIEVLISFCFVKWPRPFLYRFHCIIFIITFSRSCYWIVLMPRRSTSISNKVLLLIFKILYYNIAFQLWIRICAATSSRTRRSIRQSKYEHLDCCDAVYDNVAVRNYCCLSQSNRYVSNQIIRKTQLRPPPLHLLITVDNVFIVPDIHYKCFLRQT